jgi:hypothetical protein
MDSGNSWDGGEMTHYLRFPYYHYGSPRTNKLFRRATFELQAPSSTDLVCVPSFGFNNPEIDSAENLEMSSLLSAAGFWDIDNWDEFYWGSATVESGRVKLSGSGVNLGLYLQGDSTYEDPHNIHGVTVHYSQRAMRR